MTTRRGFLQAIAGLFAGGAVAKVLPAEAAPPPIVPGPKIGDRYIVGGDVPAEDEWVSHPVTCAHCTRRDSLIVIEGQPGLFRCRRTGRTLNVYSEHFRKHSEVLLVECADDTLLGVRDLRGCPCRVEGCKREGPHLSPISGEPGSFRNERGEVVTIVDTRFVDHGDLRKVGLVK